MRRVKFKEHSSTHFGRTAAIVIVGSTRPLVCERYRMRQKMTVALILMGYTLWARLSRCGQDFDVGVVSRVMASFARDQSTRKPDESGTSLPMILGVAKGGAQRAFDIIRDRYLPMTMSTFCNTARQSLELFPLTQRVQPFAMLPKIS